MTTPIVTIAQNNSGTWDCYEVQANRTRYIQTCNFEFSAYAVATLYADRNKIYFIAPRTSFLSIAQDAEKRFYVVEARHSEPSVVKALPQTSFDQALRLANFFARKNNQPVLPHYWIPKQATVLK